MNDEDGDNNCDDDDAEPTAGHNRHVLLCATLRHTLGRITITRAMSLIILELALILYIVLVVVLSETMSCRSSTNLHMI
jgi:hypothetical protein